MRRKIGVQGFSHLTHKIAISPIWRVNIGKKKKRSHLKIPHCPVQQKFTLTLSKKKFPARLFLLTCPIFFVPTFLFLHFSPVFSFKCCFLFFNPFFSSFILYFCSLSLSLSQCSALHFFFNKSIIRYFLYLIGVL